MAIETELKLRIRPEHLARLKRHALFKSLQISASGTHKLHNIYFDTPTLELHQRKMALRLRRVGGQWLQTLKGGGAVKSGLHERYEWEFPVPAAKLDFSNLEEQIWSEHLPTSLREQLVPVFTTVFYRTSRLLDWHGAIIEVCLDHGDVLTSTCSTPICEIELELKSGHPQHLFELAQEILKIVPFELELVSKAEQGFRLLSGYTARPVKSELPRLTQTDTLTDGLQVLIWSCLAHWQHNLHGAMSRDALESHDAEYLHQMRVAMRRLRVVLRMTEELCADDVLTALRTELAGFGVMLGQVRELDVFIAETLQPMYEAIDGNSGQRSLNALLASCEQQRADCYAALHLKSREVQQVLLRFSLWMNSSYWCLAEQGAPEPREFASRRLHHLNKRYMKAGMNLHVQDASQLHALRIHAKKLRYSAECFVDLYPKNRTHTYLAALSDVQELLGKINDISVAHRLLDELASRLPDHREVVLFIKGAIEIDLSFKFKKLKRSIKVFNTHGVFWE